MGSAEFLAEFPADQFLENSLRAKNKDLQEDSKFQKQPPSQEQSMALLSLSSSLKN